MSFISSAAKSAGVTDIGLLILLITSVGLMYRYIFKPMHEKINEIPSYSEVSDILDSNLKMSLDTLADVSRRLEKIEEKLSKADISDDLNHISMKDLRAEIESVKTILNQFQGHMMYGGRRSSDFGNQELR